MLRIMIFPASLMTHYKLAILMVLIMRMCTAEHDHDHAPVQVLNQLPPLCLVPPPSLPFRPPPPRPPPRLPRTDHKVWCVAKPTVPASSLQRAMDYACGSGADCMPIQLNGLCFQPDSVLAHASYAFNSYWQRTKRAGGTCNFDGSAMLVTVDPSYEECHFIYG